jgi:hypothetical protein
LVPLAPALLGREARVDEDALPEVIAMLSPKPLPSSPEEVIELSNEDEPEILTPSGVIAPIAPIVNAIPVTTVAIRPLI